MNPISYPGWLQCVAMFLGATASVAAAQTQSKPDAARPPELHFRSVFEGYQKFKDQPPAPWTQSNTTVEKIGGWRFYAKEAQAADASAGAEKAPIASPKPSGHNGHGGKP